MRNLVSRNPRVIAAMVNQADYREYFGLLTSPRSGYNPASAVDLSVRWAADNDCFAFWKRSEPYNVKPLLRALERWKPYAAHCLFVNAPDVLVNAKATREQFPYWRDVIRGAGFPVAFTVQNGIEDYPPPPWCEFDALFIGSTDRVKYSDHVSGLVREATARGLWVHNGRVNTPRAVAASRRMGCDSFDGTGFTKKPSKIFSVLPFQKADIQPLLF